MVSLVPDEGKVHAVLGWAFYFYPYHLQTARQHPQGGVNRKQLNREKAFFKNYVLSCAK